jgi:hypothetical protein
MEGLNIQQIIRDTIREYQATERRVESLIADVERPGEVFVTVRLRGSRFQVASDLRQMAELICPT